MFKMNSVATQTLMHIRRAPKVVRCFLCVMIVQRFSKILRGTIATGMNRSVMIVVNRMAICRTVLVCLQMRRVVSAVEVKIKMKTWTKFVRIVLLVGSPQVYQILRETVVGMRKILKCVAETTAKR